MVTNNAVLMVVAWYQVSVY